MGRQGPGCSQRRGPDRPALSGCIQAPSPARTGPRRAMRQGDMQPAEPHGFAQVRSTGNHLTSPPNSASAQLSGLVKEDHGGGRGGKIGELGEDVEQGVEGDLRGGASARPVCGERRVLRDSGHEVRVRCCATGSRREGLIGRVRGRDAPPATGPRRSSAPASLGTRQPSGPAGPRPPPQLAAPPPPAPQEPRSTEAAHGNGPPNQPTEGTEATEGRQRSSPRRPHKRPAETARWPSHPSPPSRPVETAIESPARPARPARRRTGPPRQPTQTTRKNDPPKRSVKTDRRESPPKQPVEAARRNDSLNRRPESTPHGLAEAPR